MKPELSCETCLRCSTDANKVIMVNDEAVCEECMHKAASPCRI